MSAHDLWNWGKLLLKATAVTIEVSLLAFAIGFVLALGLTAARMNGGILVRHAAEMWVAVLRGVPDLLVIYLLFFGGIVALNEMSAIVGQEGGVPPPVFTGSIAVGLIASALLSEVFRGAVLAIDKGHIEAARAFGISGWAFRRRILFPLALRSALPGIGNIWLSVIKGSALVSVTGVAEILRQAQVAAGSTRQPFIFYSIAAILYIIIAVLSSRWLSWLDTRMAPEKR